MKPNKKPAIVAFVITALLVIAGLLTIFVPKFIVPKAPVNLRGNNISLTKYTQGFYVLKGELQNVSDETVTIKNNGGMKITFKNADPFTDNWRLDSNDRPVDVVLEPGEIYDFADCDWYLTGSTSVLEVTVNIDGNSYKIYGNPVPMAVPVILFFAAVIALLLALSLLNGAKRNAKRLESINAFTGNLGGDFVMMTGSISDKDESKKAAAKTAGWVFGAVISTLFTGGGVYRVYSGTAAYDFLVSEDRLLLIKGAATPEDFIAITKNDFPVDSLTVKKNSIVIKCADKKQVITLHRMRKCALTTEQLAERINNILVKGVNAEPVTPLNPQADGEVESTPNVSDGLAHNGQEANSAEVAKGSEEVAAADGDPFAEFTTEAPKNDNPADGEVSDEKPEN